MLVFRALKRYDPGQPCSGHHETSKLVGPIHALEGYHYASFRTVVPVQVCALEASVLHAAN